MKNFKLWSIISLGIMLLLILGFIILKNTNKNESETKGSQQAFKDSEQKGADEYEKSKEEKEASELHMYIGSTNNYVKVVCALDTKKSFDVTRGTKVTRIGDVIELQKNFTTLNPQSKDENLKDVFENDKSTDTQNNILEKKESEEDSKEPNNIIDKENSNDSLDETKENITKTIKVFKIEYTDEHGDIMIGYVEPEFLVETQEESIKEDVIYTRTPTHLYSLDKQNLITLIEKGSKLEVLGFSNLDILTGQVKWYKVSLPEQNEKGFVRAKYFVQNEADALEVFNENNILDIHATRGNRFNAGAATELDFFPRIKAEFDDNKMPDEVNALYINSGSIRNAAKYIEVAKGTRINAFVVDIKDNTTPAFPADAMKLYSPTNYEKAKKYFNTTEQYSKNIQKLKDANFYLIGRITVFKDAYYIRDHPAHAVTNTSTNKPYLHNNTYWPSPFIRDVWEFNVALAKEAVEKFGFNEIQFDYIRFPDRTANAERSGLIDFKNVYGETKSQAIQRFSMYAVDELNDLGVYVAGDVFGEAAHQYVTPYGQYWPALSNVFDVISPMAYPDHFSPGDYGFDFPWLYPYDLIKLWSGMALSRQSECPTPAIIRPWIQSHDSRVPPAKPYGAAEVSAQLRGYYDAGINNGYMTWWSSSSISGYMSEREAYKKEY